MRPQAILVIIGLLFVVFGLGLWMGSHLRWERPERQERPVNAVETPVPPPSAPLHPTAPAGGAPPCADIRNLEPLIGTTGCVSGLVLRVYSSRSGNTYLDFCQDYRNCPFSSVIFAADKNKFGDVGALQGKRAEIRGEIRNYQGRAEIIIRDPQQIRATR